MELVAIIFLQIVSVVVGLVLAFAFWFKQETKHWVPYAVMPFVGGILGFWSSFIILEWSLKNFMYWGVMWTFGVILGYAGGAGAGVVFAWRLSRRLKAPLAIADASTQVTKSVDVMGVILICVGLSTIIGFIMHRGGFGESVFLEGKYPHTIREFVLFVILMGWVISPYLVLALACSLIRRTQSSGARLACIRLTLLIALCLSIAYYYQVCFPVTPRHLDITPYLMFPAQVFIASPIVYSLVAVLGKAIGLTPKSG